MSSLPSQAIGRQNQNESNAERQEGEAGAGAAGSEGAGKDNSPALMTIIQPSSTDLRLAMDYNKLKGQSNYITWSERSQSALEYLSFWNYVTGETPKPPLSNPSREVWTQNDKKALFLLKNRTEENLSSRIRTCSTSSDLWEKLEEMYKLKGVSGKQAAWENWERVHLKEGGDVSQYLADHDTARATVEELGTQVDNEFAALRLLMGLPHTWSVFKVTVETGAADRGENLDYDKIYRLISQEDNRRKAEKSRLGQKKHPIEIDQDSALAAQEKPRTQLTCTHCKRNGHEREKCWKIIGYPNDRKRKERKEEYPEDGSSGANAAAGSVPFDFVGSLAVKQQSRTTSRAVRKPSTSPESTRPRPSLYLADMDVVLAVQEVNESIKLFSAKGEDNYTPFLLDSGCSYHMCSNLSWFTNLDGYDGPTVTTAGHAKHKVTKKGTICFASEVEGVKRAFSLTDVNYIPNFSNLLSVGALKEKGVKIDFSGKGFTLTSTKGTVFAKGSDHPTNLFKLDAEVVIGNLGGQVNAATMESKTKQVLLWHRRLCHGSVPYLQALVEKNVIAEVTQQEVSDILKANPCITCTKGKGHCQPFQDSESKASVPLELAHSDVKGPVPIQTNGGYRYWLTFLDDSTRFLWTYPIQSKRDVVQITKDWISLVENQYKLKLRKMRTDNGSEYSKLDMYLQERGIRRETTVPHTAQQNGRAERVNRSLSEKIACMMIDAGMAPSYWGEALLFLTYVINRTPSRPMEMSTPYEALHGIPPSLSDLRVWGSPCQALILPRRNGFEAKTTDCVLLGYSEVKKAYRLLEVKTKKVIHSREVTFFEIPDKHKDLRIMPHDINNENSPITSPEDVGSPDTDRGRNDGEEDIFYDADGSPREEYEQAEEGLEQPLAEGELFHDEDQNNADENVQPDRDLPRQQPQRERPVRNRRAPGHWWIADAIERARVEAREQVNFAEVEENDTFSFLVSKAVPETSVPKTYEEAMQSANRKEWIKAMDAELASMKENQVWTLMPLPPGRKAVGCKWVFAIKLDADGLIIKYKARIVAQGFTQRAGIDFYETYAPVARMNSTRIFLAYTTQARMFIIQADVKTAYLNGEMKEEVYMRAPSGVDNPKGFVCKIQRSLYGLKQSAHEWNNRIDRDLRTMDFKPLDVEPCVYVRRKDGAMIILYVDDIVGVSHVT